MFPLHPETPEEGRSLEELFNSPSANITQIVAGLKEKAASLGLPFGDRHMTYNSRLAQELGLWAESKGRGHAFHMVAFTAYFVDGKNIAKPDILKDLAIQSGLDGDEAMTVISSRSFKDAVDSDWQLSREKNVTAVPTFSMGKHSLVGAQSYQSLQQLMAANDLKPKSGSQTPFPTI